MIRAGIIGGAGYTAGELIRLLMGHPSVDLAFVHSESHAGARVDEVHAGLVGDTDLRFTNSCDLAEADVLFLCLGHGKSREFWQQHPYPDGLRVIDLAQDYRDESEGYVYGLPEWQACRIAQATRIANPGCFATAIQLGLLPLAQAHLLHGDVSVTAVTGSTGAGVRPGPTTHFSWRANNLSVYKPFTHQHLAEIGRNLTSVQKSDEFRIRFVPMRGDFARGIYASLFLPCDLTGEEALRLYADYYARAPFTHVPSRGVDLKQVLNTNKALLHVSRHDDVMLVISAIDNLLKGAVGQAVQNMNLMMGLDETAGLHLKASAF